MKLIKINTDHYVVVDKTIQPVNGYYYDSFINKIKNTNSAEYGEASHCWQITHSTQPLEGVELLSLSEVKKLIGEVDVEKEMISPYPMDTQNDVDWCNGYQRGYNQALEDNKDRKYTEEDILNILYDYDNVDWSKREHKQSVIMMKEWLYEKLQSFQPKTEWNVEMVDGKLKLM